MTVYNTTVIRYRQIGDLTVQAIIAYLLFPALDAVDVEHDYTNASSIMDDVMTAINEGREKLNRVVRATDFHNSIFASLYHDGKRIDAIKLCMQLYKDTPLGRLKEAKDYCEANYSALYPS